MIENNDILLAFVACRFPIPPPATICAAFSAAINLANASRGPCTEGTRVDIIEKIMAWAKETDPAKAVLAQRTGWLRQVDNRLHYVQAARGS